MGDLHLEVGVDGDTVPVVLRPLTHLQWTRLVDQHPSTDPGWKWNQETFEPALLKAVLVEPELDDAAAVALADDQDVGGYLIGLAHQISRPDSLFWARERLARDDRLRLEMGYCTAAGISRTVFLTWEPRDQELALAYQESKARVCPGCGVPEADMANFDAWTTTGRSCFHCMSLAQARKTIPDEAASSTHFHLVRPG